MDQDCIFCKIINKEIPGDIVHEDDKCIAFKDINPAAPQHILVVPKKHISKVSNVEVEDEALLGHLIVTAKNYAQKEGIDHYKLQFNVGEKGGQVVFHIHLHLLGYKD